MFYLYFALSLVTSALFLIFFIQKKSSPRAIICVLLAPITAPYFFARSNPESPLKHRLGFTIVFFLCFFLVATGEYYLFSQEKVRLAMAQYSPVARHMIQLSEQLKASTMALDQAIIRLESMSKVVSKPTGIGEALSFIGTLRVRMLKNKNDVQTFMAFTRDYRGILEKEGFNDILFMEDFFTNPAVVVYLESLDYYLESFETLLNYTFDNFEKIENKSPLYLQNYDAYYMAYRRAVDRHNRLCVKRIEFQKKLVEEHPGLEQYLPTMIHTDFLKLWE